MTFSVKTISALLDDEIERAIERLRAARRQLKNDIEVSEAEIARRAARRREERRR